MTRIPTHPAAPRARRVPRALLGLAAVGLVGAGAACTPVEDDEESSANADPSVEVTGSGSVSGGSEGSGGSGDSDDSAGTGSYAAGEYTATGTYTTPGGEEQVGVTLTLQADGTISALSVQEMGVNPNSKQFQGLFASGIADVAVGQSIADLEVDVVAGSSLTSGGFNAAVDAIEAEAQA